MIKHGSRKIGSETVRRMTLWSHYAFQQKLKHKGEQLGCRIHEVSEHYTSKSCGRCGRLHHALGGSKVFKCPFCGWIMDRDFNAARNIFIMNVEDFIGDVYTAEEQKGIRNPVLQH